MTRQNISVGTTANDGTGDTLRQAGIKINDNFTELYTRLGGDGDTLSTQVTLEDSAVVFEGSTTDAYETRLIAENATADRTLRFPNVSGNIVVDGATQTLTNKTITSPTITDPKISTEILDSNGNEIIKLSPADGAVREITIGNSDSSGYPFIKADGTTDSAVNLELSGKPGTTGAVTINKLALLSIGGNSSALVDDDNGDVDETVSHVICNKTSGTLALTLQKGTVSGELKVFTNRTSNNVTITPSGSIFAGVSSITIGNKGSLTCIWDDADSNWFVLSQYNSTISS